MQQSAFGFGRQEFTVSELNSAIRSTLGSEFGGIWVTGEITETKQASSGHFYFTLKDATSRLKCVCFKSAAWKLRVKPRDGIQVAARGTIDVYEPRGEYQFLVEALQPRGEGALQLEFEALKRRLAEEGLFEAARKRPLPRYPRRIGLVTSPTGAVVQDMLNVLTRRFPGLHIRVYPAQVQGEDSVRQICEGIRYFSESGWPDVVIVGRGGGSLEDLWSFNTEFVARAIAASRVPVISAVGHETDFTIADFVADLRAPTPSAAAELVVGTRRELTDRLRNDLQRLERGMRLRLAQASERLHRQGVGRAQTILQRRLAKANQRTDELDYRLRDQIQRRLNQAHRRWNELETRLRKTDLRIRFSEAHRRLDRAHARLHELIAQRQLRLRHRLDSAAAQLGHLSPLAILERGYAVVEKPGGEILRDAAATAPGDALAVRLARGRLGVTVNKPEKE
jgi:exodeoxyribonuclease VII large subunit